MVEKIVGRDDVGYNQFLLFRLCFWKFSSYGFQDFV